MSKKRLWYDLLMAVWLVVLALSMNRVVGPYMPNHPIPLPVVSESEDTTLRQYTLNVPTVTSEEERVYQIVEAAYEDEACESFEFTTTLDIEAIEDILSRSFGHPYVFSDLSSRYKIQMVSDTENLCSVTVDRISNNVSEGKAWIRNVAERIRNDMGDNPSAKKAARLVNKVIRRQTCYGYTGDTENPYPDCAAIGAIEGTAICAGYARLYTCLMTELGYENAYVVGYSADGTYHAWNEVRLEDGSWLSVDTTMNDQHVVGPYFWNGEFAGRKVENRFVHMPMVD